MKRFILFVPVVFMLTACSPAHMVKKDQKLDISAVKPEPGKAALVVARTTSLGYAVNFFNHVGKKLIGVTRGKGCFVKTDIEPGTQYLIARTESLETGKIDFEAGKIYYVQQSPRLGWMVARVSLDPVSPEHLASEIDAEGCAWYELDTSDPGDPLTEHEYGEAVTDYERELKEGHHKEFAIYKGFAPKVK